MQWSLGGSTSSAGQGFEPALVPAGQAPDRSWHRAWKGEPSWVGSTAGAAKRYVQGPERRRHQGGSRTIGAQEGDLSPLNRTGQTSDCGNCEPRYLSQGTGRSPRQKQGKRQGRRQHAVRGRAAGRSLSCPTKGVERGISRRLTFSPEGSSSAAPPAIPLATVLGYRPQQWTALVVSR